MSIISDAKNLLSKISSGATSVGNYFNPESNGGQNFWSTPVAQGLGQVQQQIPNVVKKGLPFPQVTVPIVKQAVTNLQKQGQESMNAIKLAGEAGRVGFKNLAPEKRNLIVKNAVSTANIIGMNAPEQKIAQVATPIVSGTESYLKELAQNQSLAKNEGSVVTKLGGKVNNFLNDVKAKIVDSTAPIEDILGQAEKKNKFNVLPTQDIRLQIDRVLRSNNLAGQFAKDNGLVNIIKEAPDLNALNQYMIAKQAGNVEKLGITTGRNLTKDQQLIKDLAPVYEPFAQQVNQYTRKLLQYSVDTGLVSQSLANDLIKKYPEYVPLNRVFSEVEKAGQPFVGNRAVASLSKQSVVQKLQGSEREIVNPLESIIAKTSDAFNQGERNVAARQLASYSNLPGFKNLITEATGNVPTHSFSYLDNGVKRVFQTTPEIAAAAKSLDVQQIGLLGKIFRTPTRILQLGATGLNLPFVVTNVVKDQMTSFVNSNKIARTSLLNPINFGKALFAAVGHGQLYDEVVRNAAGGTSFDIARGAPELTVQGLRAGKNIGSRIKYTVTNPGELLRAVENIVGRGEELTRIQQYSGTKGALLSEGRTAQDAALLAAKAARENTANFARKGEWSKVLNAVIPFFNAGIQGARQLVRSFVNHPVGTTSKIGIGLFFPAAVATAWNLSDPNRKNVYNDIKPYEKDNNLIIIPPAGATKDSQGRYNVIKIPIPPGLSNLTRIVTRSIEAASGLDPVKFNEIAANLITAGTSIDVTDPSKIAGSFTPQLVKPVLETSLNKNLYTGQDIVPSYMQYLPPEAQVKDSTPQLARTIGGVLGVSPLKVQNFVSTAGGGLGNQLLGVESPQENLQRRFSKASSGNQLDKAYSVINNYSGVTQQINALVKEGNKDKALQVLNKNPQVSQYGKIIKAADSRITKLQKVKRDINALNLPPDQKQTLLDRADWELNTIARTLLTTIQK